MTAFEKTTLTSPMAAPRRELRRLLRELLGGVLIFAVWIFLWSWVALGVLAPLGRVSGEGRAAPAAVERLRA